ncbi:tetratricopeptide repeat protein [Maribacter confluentis]|uniref:Tetratricopeptide repeat protein n=1 Tax=Maribacter confluentis TaxID=1656093 RepID=A0ABT8RU31_9FLAO|nr:tetratricopeptide repeat protein [Maribacter confluentis]MDO1514335.1 tetratricopeptide repeat protein [Maribacter confluentis]
MKKPNSTQRFFTNREKHFISFKNAIKNLNTKKLSILSFYGVGGIGKTRLKKELIKTIAEDKSYMISSSLDFQQVEFRNVSTAMHILYKDLKSKGINFPTFEVAHAVCWQKSHPEQSLRQSSLPFIEEGSIVFDIISIAQDVPIVGILPKIGSLIYKVKKEYNKWWAKYGEKELQNLSELQPYEIERSLPYYFAVDLNHYIENSPDKKIIFFLDTFESLWENHHDRKAEKFFSKDKWLRELIKYVPQVLWVILGREQLRWQEIDSDVNWFNYIQEYSLGELAFKDAEKFLLNCNVKEKEIRERIIATSKGLPFYLDLQVDTYKIILDNDNIPKVEKFGKNYNDILVRFSKYLSVAEIETLKILSCTKIWNYEIFKKIIKEFQTGFPLTSFKELLTFSFINQINHNNKEDFFSIHEIMRSHLKINLDNEIRKDIHRFLFQYYQDQLELESINLIEINPSAQYLIEEAIYHKKKCSDFDDFCEWLLLLSKKLYGENKSTSVQESLIKALTTLDIEKKYTLSIEMCYEIARLFSWKNDDFESVNEYTDKGIKILEKVIKSKYSSNEDTVIKEEPELLKLKVDLLLEKASVFHDLDLNFDAYKKYQEAIILGKKINYPINLLGYSRVLLELGKVPEAEGYFYSQLTIHLKNGDLENQALYYNELGNTFLSQKMHTQAYNYFNESLNIYQNIKDDNHRYVFIVKKKYAESLIYLGKAQEAKSILQNILEWYKKNYGENYFEIGYVYLVLAKAEKELKNYQNAIYHCFRCIKFLYPKLGLANREVANSQVLFCEIFQTIIKEKINNKIEYLTEDEFNFYYNSYSTLIEQFEFSFLNDFNTIQIVFGYSGNFLSDYFEILHQYYTLNQNNGKINNLNRKRLESERIFSEQFRFRLFESKEKLEVLDEERVQLKRKLKNEIGIIIDSSVRIYMSPLSFYKKGWVYHLIYINEIVKYIVECDNKLYCLDFTNYPIYDMNKEFLIFSGENIMDYIFFFFDGVKGRHGKFYIPHNKNDIPFKMDMEIDEKTKELIRTNIQTARIIEITKNEIIVESNLFFLRSLMKVTIIVDNNGFCKMKDEKIILENLPIEYEPQIRKVKTTDDQIVLNIISFLEIRLKTLRREDVDIQLFLDIENNIKTILANKDELKNYYELVSSVFDNSLFIMEKYVKPTYDNELVYIKEVGQMLNIMKQVSDKSELIKTRKRIVYNYRYKGELESKGLSTLDKTEIEDFLSDKLNIKIYDYKISQYKLSFFDKTKLYQINSEQFKTHYILKNEKEIYLLDSTNRPIYSLSNKDFKLSEMTVMNYLYFFFDSVIGRHGKFYIPISINDIPFNNKIKNTSSSKSLIKSKIKSLEIIKSNDSEILILGSTFFKTSLFNCQFKVDKNGICSISKEELVLDDLPILIT